MSKKKKKRIRFSGLIFILLLIYLIGMVIYYLIKLPVKNVKVEGISILKESEIIEPLGLEDNLPFLKENEVKTSGCLDIKFYNAFIRFCEDRYNSLNLLYNINCSFSSLVYNNSFLLLLLLILK